ncbi:hypothetical protein CTI14_57500, partial [Methylobacterium radiotolerans]
TRLQVAPRSVQKLHGRWRIHGSGALVAYPTKRIYPFEVKLDVVLRAIAGETKVALAQEFGLSSSRIIEKWLAASTRLQVAPRSVQKLHGRWRIHGSGALVAYPTKR